MLAIRMQRVGRKGYAQFRVIIQDSHRSPATGKIVAYAGSYDPHTKEVSLDKEIIDKFLSNGAQPSQRVAILLKKEGYKLPSWVIIDESGKRTTKNAEKLRKNQPKEAKPVQKVAKKPEKESIEELEEELVEEIAEEVVEEVIEEEAEKIVKEKAAEEVVEKTAKETKSKTAKEAKKEDK